ncbi:MAG: ATP-dependent zinc metalloprotease FtsH [Phycisphaerales bacterium]|nr:ATP-dependent zinc metalloprotease FtsH [Phycisphaerales bacterium]
MANTPNTPPDPSKRDNGQRPGGRPPAGQPPAGRGVFGFILVLLLVALLFMMFQGGGGGTQITLHEFREAWQNNEIVEDSVVVRESQVTARRRPGPDADSDRPTLVVVNMNAADRMYVAGQIHEITGDRAQGQRPSAFMPLLYALLPVLLIVMILVFLFARAAKSAGAGAGMLGNFGKSKHRTLTKEMTGITFKDVAGIDEAKDEVGEIIEFLKNPKKFTKLGGRIPRGVLLTGPPGCGKTLLAKAIAGEADVPFFSISGSDFVEMFVGVGASRVRDLFKQAKDSAPCIIFLDEIDAVGRKRGSGFSSGGNDEREQTLNAILVEMDGFNPSDGVIVIAATNRSEILDAALVRPGRFDRQIAVPLPDVKGRLEILRVHAKKVKLGPDVDMERVAKITPMFSGADLAAAINEAAIAATMHDKDYIEQADIEEARDKIRFGRARKSRVREKEDNRLVAYHEAGHAVLQVLLPDSDPLHKVTIIPRGDAGGATFSLPDKDRMGYSLKWLRATMIMACGGRIAEEKAMGDMSSGASGDIAQITRIARTMISEWGMSDSLGFVRYGWNEGESYMPEREYSDVTAELIDKEVRRIVEEAYREGERMLEDHWDQVVAVAESLLKYETLSSDEVEKLMRGEDLGKPTVSELLAREAKQAAAKPETKKPKPDEDTDMPPNVSPSPA